jgi:hypothetical protein
MRSFLEDGTDVAGGARFAHYWWQAQHVWLLKAYNIVAFATVGIGLDFTLRTSKRPIPRAASPVALYSFALEVGSHVVVGTEPVIQSAFDVLCGAVGG